MDKTPLKKIKMMDIIRRSRPERADAKPTATREETVKFSIEKRQTAHQEEAVHASKEGVRKGVVVETIPLHSVVPEGNPVQNRRTPQQVAREEIVKGIKEAAIEERAALNMRAEKIEEARVPVPVKKAEERHEAPRILETHAPEEHHVSSGGPHSGEHAEPRPESLPPSAYRQASDTQPAEKPLVMPEVSSLEMDRPIAYIPKEKPTREEKRVLERIEKRERSQKREMTPGKRRGVILWIIACLLLGLGAYLVIAVLPRAEIVLIPKTVKWEYMNSIGASTKIAEIDSATRQIPVAVFSEKKTNAFSFPATGSGKSIERKATGRVTIHNEYSGSSQPLVAGTRLETPDGKIFRLKDRVIVPGAKTEGGEMIASSIEADVIADKAGESYNISPVGKFTIPGFQGTTKYDKFYAESKESMTGGFVGEGKYPTIEDIKSAKESAERQMKEVIESFLATQVVPEGFKVIESSRRFAILKETVNEAVDDQGNFTVYIEAEGGVDTLKEEHVLKLMTALSQQVNGEGYQIREYALSYGDIVIEAKTGAISLPVEFKGTFWRPILVDEFKRNTFGKDENELKSYIFSSTSIEKADVALWPIWVKRVPSDPDRVKVELK